MNEKMMSVQDEHRDFEPYLEEMDVLARSIHTVPVQELTQRLAWLHEFLAHELMPHAVAEGRILAPLVADEPGESSLTRRMTLCHAQMAKLIDELDVLRHQLVHERTHSTSKRGLQARAVWDPCTLLSAHLLEAELELQPLIQARLTPEGRELLFDKVDQYAQEVRDLYE